MSGAVCWGGMGGAMGGAPAIPGRAESFSLRSHPQPTPDLPSFCSSPRSLQMTLNPNTRFTPSKTFQPQKNINTSRESTPVKQTEVRAEHPTVPTVPCRALEAGGGSSHPLSLSCSQPGSVGGCGGLLGAVAFPWALDVLLGTLGVLAECCLQAAFLC